MRMRPLLNSVILCALAFPAGAASVRDISSCATAKDMAVCLITAAGRDYGGRALFEDAEIAANPNLIVDAGYSRATVEAAVAEADKRVLASPSGPAFAVLDEVRALDAAGKPPSVALAPAMSLSTEPISPDLAFDNRKTSLRLIGLTMLARMPNSSADLRAAARREWEKELIRRGAPAPMSDDLMGLIEACQVAGDIEGMDRALRLAEHRDDAEHIALLATAGRFQEALALSGKADLASIEATLRTEGTPPEIEFKGLFDIRIGDGSRNPNADTPKGLRLWALRLLADARTRLVLAASMKNDDAIARDAADQLIAGTDVRSLGPGILNNVTHIASTASPKRAEAWLAKLETALPVDLRDGYYRPDQLRLIAEGIVNAWRVLEREDRVDAFLTRWRPAALAEIRAYAADPSKPPETPYADVLVETLLWRDRVDEARPLMTDASALLEYEMREGRGIANLDLYLRSARNDRETKKILAACVEESVHRDEFTWLQRCLGDYARLPLAIEENIGLTTIAVQSAAIASADGDAEQSRAFLTLALTAASRVPPGDPLADEQSISDLRLLAVAKALLRADGRLPPLAPRAEQ